MTEDSELTGRELIGDGRIRSTFEIACGLVPGDSGLQYVALVIRYPGEQPVIHPLTAREAERLVQGLTDHAGISRQINDEGGTMEHHPDPQPGQPGAEYVRPRGGVLPSDQRPAYALMGTQDLTVELRKLWMNEIAPQVTQDSRDRFDFALASALSRLTVLVEGA